jgi:peptidoglycan hydrolase-like protein with peptidoglycan-binding domain
MSIKKLMIGLVAIALVCGVATTASAQTMTIEELLQQITLLQSQISSLGGSTTGTPAATTFTRDLTIGSQGVDVTALQQWLIARGVSIPAGATGYFGTQTQAALRSYQASVGISPASGYFGPITRAHVNSMSAPVGPTPGGSLPTGCTSTAGFSPITGEPCSGGTTPTPGPTGLEGGAGSIETVDEISKYSSEQVGEDEEDVEVAGIEIEADNGSDIEITAVRLDFATQPSNSDLDEFVTEVSIWLDGEEYARVDADEFNDDNSWTKTVTLDAGAIIRAGEKGDLVVAVSGVNNIDSNDAGDDWGLDFLSVRFADASGAIITETLTTTEFTWDVNTFATAADVQIKAQTSDDTPSTVVNVDDTSDTNDVELLRFTLKAEGSDIEVKDLPITFATSTGNTADTIAEILSSVTLEIEGEDVGSENASSAVSDSAGATITFNDIDYTIEEGDTVEVVVKGDINDTEAGAFVDGDQLTVSFSASNRESADIEDSTGEDLVSGDRTGLGTGEALAFYDVGINVTFVSATETMTPGADGTADDDTVTLKLVFDVEAFDGTVYVSNNGTPTVAADGGVTAIDVDDGGILYRYEIDSTATVGLLADVVSKSDTTGTVSDQQVSGGDGGEYTFEDGEAARITLTVTRSNATTHVDSDGYHEMQLVAIGWSTTNEDDTMNVYEFDLEDFDTDPIHAN